MKTFKVYLRLNYTTDVIYVTAKSLEYVPYVVQARVGHKSILQIFEMLKDKKAVA